MLYFHTNCQNTAPRYTSIQHIDDYIIALHHMFSDFAGFRGCIWWQKGESGGCTQTKTTGRGMLAWKSGNKDVSLVATFYYYLVSCISISSRYFVLKMRAQSNEVGYRPLWCSRILRSYSRNKLKEFVFAIKKPDGWTVWYWLLPRSTYCLLLLLFCMLKSCPNDTTDSVILQLVVIFPWES